MLENSTHGLTLLDAAHTVVVVGEEHHQAVLAPWAPVGDGQPRHVAVELRPAPITVGADAGRPGVEVLLDGWRVGELAPLMAERYLPHVHDLLGSGGRPAAVALVAHGPHGDLEIELRLPDVTEHATTALHAVRPAHEFAPVPRPRDRRVPYLVGGGVLALLLVVGATVAGGREDDDGWTRPAASPTTSVRPSPTLIPTVPASVTPDPIAEQVVADVARTRPRAAVPVTPAPAPAVPAPAPAPAPVEVQPSTSAAAPTEDGDQVDLFPVRPNPPGSTSSTPPTCAPAQDPPC
ncbi:hypothetical protein ACFFTK_30760 [Pseudonocardia petroleophila]|uniref:Uncharacterized protein n=1 Tax=Pseudonocardia petroleophila TaxID=37331 RepID=A0A7G7MK91_9PSEU|nr:hypothetical protein [Pseudonocardia petroleophila]QNG53202.1 hypothetical protein H6H00_04125 [Pseudonocardia petroleophila]